ncbi:MAG: hypothetical protein ACRC2G_15245 [Aestuariivirga sp.]
MLPNDITRCSGVESESHGARVCPHRDDCERYVALQRGISGFVTCSLWVCETPAFEARIPRPCAGMKTRVSNRPHPMCRTNCARWRFGEPNGIKPEWRDIDGLASCGDWVALHGERSVAPDAGQSSPCNVGVGMNTVAQR